MLIVDPMAQHKILSRFTDAVKRVAFLRIFIVILFAIILGWLSFSLAVSGITRTRNPRTALIFIPTESSALGSRADQLFFANPSRPSPQIRGLARRALINQAVNAKALRLLGYIADTQGDKQRAFSLVTTAAKLSRRDAGAQLWLIEFHAQANDNSKTLKHYDALLSTKPETQTMLYPRLSRAIEDQAVRSEMLPFMRRGRSWMESFLSHATANSKDLTGLVSLIVEAKGYTKTESARPMALNLIERLVREKRFLDARRIYFLVSGGKAGRLTDPAFDNDDRGAQFGMMGWQISDYPDAGGGFSGNSAQGKPQLSIFANSATTQIAASRLLYLPPGSYSFSYSISEFALGQGGYIRFQLRCPTTSAPSPVWMFEADVKRSTSTVDVPSDCPVQYLEILTSGGNGQLGMEATIDTVAIVQRD